MKKVLFALLVLLCVAGTTFAADKAPATSDSPAKLAVSFNPLGLLIFSFPVSGEYAVTDQISVVADIFYSPNIVWISNISVFDINAGARYYFGDMLGSSVPDWVKGPALKGAFGGVRIAYSNETWTYTYGSDTWKGTYSAFGLGAEAGLKYFLKGTKGFYAEGTLGFMYYFPATWSWTFNGTTYDWGSYAPSAGYDPTSVTYGVNIGYAF